MNSILIWQVLMLIIAMVVLAHFAQHGLGEMRRSIRQFTIFMLDKAPVGMVDLFSNKTGSASRNWMMFGAIWFTLAATIGFLKAWLLYDSTALDSLASIGWEYNAETMSRLAEHSLFWGFLSMTFIGAGLHINARLCGGGKIGSEANASLVAFGWFGVTVLSMVLPFFIEMGHFENGLIWILYSVLALAIVANHLLTIGMRGDAPIIVPTWFILFGTVLFAAALFGMAQTEIAWSLLADDLQMRELQWMCERMINGWWPLSMILATCYYIIPKSTGNPIWSQTLTSTSLVLLFITVPVFGMGVANHADGAWVSLAAVLVAVSLFPILAASSNMIATMQGKWSSVVSNPAAASAAMASILLPILALFTFFSALDLLGGTGDLVRVQGALDTGMLWSVGGLVCLAAWFEMYPLASGAVLASRSKARWAFWLVFFGSLFFCIINLMSEYAILAMEDADVESPQNHLSGFYLASSVAFYGITIGAFVTCLNLIQTSFSNQLLEESGVSDEGMDSFTVGTGTHTIRGLLGRGVGIDTPLLFSTENVEVSGSTSIEVSTALMTDEGVVMPEVEEEIEQVAEDESAPLELIELAKWLSNSKTSVFDLFQQMDLDNDQELSPFEVREGLAKLELASLPPWDVITLVAAMDLNGDGKVNLPELDIYMMNIISTFDSDKDVEADETLSTDELKKMKKADLVELAKSKGLSTSGTKADLVDRITDG